MSREIQLTVKARVDDDDPRLCGRDCPGLDKAADLCDQYEEELDCTWDVEVEGSPTIYERCAACLRAERKEL